MKRKKMYVSGAISGYSPILVKTKFNEAERVVSALGFSPVNPLNNGIDECHSWTIHMIADILILIRCRHVYFQKDWEYSRGAMIEFKIAKCLKMKLYFETKSYFVNKTKWHVVENGDKTYRVSHKR
ncbi:DUF4406 domain-containing protein [uncultured Bacteroides sp.]|uniref:DUF4406 domain-containing protein n=1 Tax=uncultured Bacteroides sp. TaxID=162156 RepID=UPI002AA7F2F0|nr:DUF4406 domain-containing protein [uncultured Bacteroides sp.]